MISTRIRDENQNLVFYQVMSHLFDFSRKFGGKRLSDEDEDEDGMFCLFGAILSIEEKNCQAQRKIESNKQ